MRETACRLIFVLVCAIFTASMLASCNSTSSNTVITPGPDTAAPASTTTTGPSAFAPDIIFKGGPILTINPMRQVEALAVRKGLIVSVGTERDVLALKGSATKIVDLGGKTLMPGFVEPHLHVDQMAQNTFFVQVGSEQPGGTSIAEVKQLLAQALPNVPPGGWLVANGVDPSRTTPLFASLTVQDLDSISTTVPIFVSNTSGHIAYVNSKAYQLAGITNTTPNPPGGSYGHDANGNLDGQVFEAPAFQPFLAQLPPTSPQAIVAAFRTALTQISQAGVTTCGDLFTGLIYGVSNEVDILRAVAPDSPVRIRCYLHSLALGIGQPAPFPPFTGDDKLRFVGIKFTLDGSTQGFTAALKQPYLNSTSTGTLNFPSTDTLLAAARPYFEQGWQLSFHANGDRAAEQALDVYQELLANTADPASRRLRLEHFTVTEESQVQRVKQLGATVSMTIGHVYFWGQVFDQFVLGPTRAARLDPAGSVKASGTRFSFNSDCTVTSVNPLRYMSNAITRVPQLNPPAILGPEQRIDIDDALRAMTIDAAYQLFVDDKVGSLEVGKYADLVILSQNPRSVDPFHLTDIKVTDVYLAGVRQGP